MDYRTGETVYVGRPSLLGNPFSHSNDTIARFKARTVEQAILKYKDWLWAKVYFEQDQVIIQELRRLRDLSKQGTLKLECWCAPRPCHAEIIKEAIESWQF
ncbi:hypothetical protein SHAb15599_00088 [Acinetobacter phage SH-Ab 15599]|nr:hypothetical protein SHAb15599_00088 [Acinetobacter phage SH-Ab 15599]